MPTYVTLASKVAQLEAELNELMARYEHEAMRARVAQRTLDALPEVILTHVTDNYGEPCDEGLRSFFDDAGLPMPKRTKTVKVEWTETFSYYAEDDIECEWNDSRGCYWPTDDAEQSLRESAYESMEGNGDNCDYEVTVD